MAAVISVTTVDASFLGNAALFIQLLPRLLDHDFFFLLNVHQRRLL